MIRIYENQQEQRREKQGYFRYLSIIQGGQVVNNIVKQYEMYLSQTQNLDEIWTTKLEIKLGQSVITWQVNL